MEQKKPNGLALLPIIIFLIVYLGSGIYYEYINPVEGGMGFYVTSVVVAFMIALAVAFVQNKELPFDEKITACAKGIGDDNITIMLFIFLLAGAFSGVAKASGGADSTAYMLLDIIPANFAVPGLFIIACIISMAMGTSCGTITVLAPIAISVAKTAHLSLPLCIGTIVGGAMFGDNLSFISDTTIAATKTQGIAMKEKFKANFRIALPAAIATLILLVILCMRSSGAEIEHFDFNFLQALPYFAVLIAALCGINVFIVLGCGAILSMIMGLITGSLTMSSAMGAMGEGTKGMFETMIVTILVASIGALMREFGGFEFILQLIRRGFKSRRGGEFGIGLLVSIMDIATANNTVAIVMAGPLAKNVSEHFDVPPARTASILDIFSCIWQGIIPYGAQLLIAAGIAGIGSITIVPFLFYQGFLLISVLISIIFGIGVKKEKE